MPLVHKLTNMHILNFKPVEMCVRPVRQLLYGLMPLPLDCISDGRRFMVTYKLGDPKFQRHPVLAE